MAFNPRSFVGVISNKVYPRSDRQSQHALRRGIVYRNVIRCVLCHALGRRRQFSGLALGHLIEILHFCNVILICVFDQIIYFRIVGVYVTCIYSGNHAVTTGKSWIAFNNIHADILWQIHFADDFVLVCAEAAIFGSIADVLADGVKHSAEITVLPTTCGGKIYPLIDETAN